MAQPRFLIGFGERLTEPIPPPRRNMERSSPYTLAEARSRLAPLVNEAASLARQLPDLACPEGFVVSKMTLHPSYIAKTSYPGHLLRAADLTAVGSRPAHVIPSRVVRSRKGTDGEREFHAVPGVEPRATTELFVAGLRSDLDSWAKALSDTDSPLDPDNDQLVQLESFALPTAEEKVQLDDDDHGDIPMELVLHAAGGPEFGFVLPVFKEFTESLDIDADLPRRITAGSLCFFPALVPEDSLAALSLFSFLRVARPMPRLRNVRPGHSPLRRSRAEAAPLPPPPEEHPGFCIAQFDGGLPTGSPLLPWVTAIEMDGLGPPVDECVEHGQHTASALLFGSLPTGALAEQPRAHVDHYRVLDDDSMSNPFELYDVIRRIDSVLSQRRYEFISMSIGPDLPIDDYDVHSWTAFLDDHLASGSTLATIAIGNNGKADRASGNARIQVPADCVNGLAIGATDYAGNDWDRAGYSALGPGRRPGVVKPDLVAFGGCRDEPFRVVAPDKAVDETHGTSFAAPTVMRTAIGVRTIFGDRLDPLTLKALLIHTAERHPDHDHAEVGWGRAQSDLESIIVCPDGTARVLYQGELTPAKYLRAQLPIPDDGLLGMVTITSTLTFATRVDPEQPSNYTRAGIDIAFRPDIDRFEPGASSARTRPFFDRHAYANETGLRNDAHKWETVLHDTKRMRASSLNRPVFDIHYNARELGHGASSPEKIRYAMVITVDAPKTPDLYDRVLRTYATQLEALSPVVDIPIRLQG